MSVPNILHVVSTRERNIEQQHRCREADRAWQALYDSGIIVPCKFTSPTRTAKDIGDPRDVPYVKDVFNYAFTRASKDDIVLYTNDDIIPHPTLPWLLQDMAESSPAISGARVDFVGDAPTPRATTERWKRSGKPHPGRDVFALVSCDYSFELLNSLPDVLVGCWGWDLLFGGMIREACLGISMTSVQESYEFRSECEIPPGYIGHIWHNPDWDTVYADSQGNKHNKRLFEEYRKKHWPDLDMNLLAEHTWRT